MKTYELKNLDLHKQVHVVIGLNIKIDRFEVGFPFRVSTDYDRFIINNIPEWKAYMGGFLQGYNTYMQKHCGTTP